MTRVCTVCTHPDRLQIDLALLDTRQNYRALARTYGLQRDALRRHKEDGHMTEKAAKARDVKDLLETDDLIGQARLLQEQSMRVLAEASAPRNPEDPRSAMKDPSMTLKAVHQSRECVRLLGEVTGKLKTPGATNINVNASATAGVVQYQMPVNGRARHLDAELAEFEASLAKQASGNGSGGARGNGKKARNGRVRRA